MLLLVSNKGIRSSRINSDPGGIYNIYSIYSFPSQSVTAIHPFVSPDSFFSTLADKSDPAMTRRSSSTTILCVDKVFEACLDKFQLLDLVAAGLVCPLEGVSSSYGLGYDFINPTTAMVRIHLSATELLHTISYITLS